MFTFENTRNLCWFNSAVQTALHIPQLANLMRSDIFEQIVVKKRKNSYEFAKELARVATEYWSSFEHEKTIDLDVLYELFVKVNRNFGGKKLYDATEAFLAIIETLDGTFVSKAPANGDASRDIDAWVKHIDAAKLSFISDVTMGQSKRVYKDENSFEHFSALTMSASSVNAGIEEYLDDKDTGITREFTHLPLILPIIFQKNADKHFIHYDTNMTIGEVEYSLFSVLLHDNAHWVSMNARANVWHLFDDSKCRKIFDVNSLIQKNSMMLLYKRKS